MTRRDYDKAARDVIAAAGYGQAFTHGIGHGIGLIFTKYLILVTLKAELNLVWLSQMSLAFI